MSEPKKKSSGVKIAAKAVVWLLVGIFLSVAIPRFIHSRQLALRNACVNHLGQIDAAKNQWAQDHKMTTNDIPTWDDLKSYLGSGDGEILKCPQGGVYTIRKIGESPTCSLGTTVTPAHVLQ
jgi:ABC-type proline/glycine betaine transport system substrate-binding protein